MKCRRVFLALGLVVVLTRPTLAAGVFSKHPKATPAERVSQLVLTLKTDTDEGKRENAAKEFREFDAKTFPEIVPVLIDVLKQDPKIGVRVEVVQTLGKLRPISQEAGQAIEAALNDASWRVRWQARQTLLGYRFSGYKSPPKPEEPSPAALPATKPSTKAVPAAAPAKGGWFSKSPKQGPGLVPNETPPPPLADPVSVPAKAIPTKANSPRQPAPAEEGPDLPLGN